MKKLILSSLAVLAFASMVITGCKKDSSTSAPTVTLNGASSVTISLNSVYSDSGATAKDEQDGVVIVTSDLSATNPDVNKAGSYTITYSATDADGNTGTAKRTVIVRNDAYYLEGNFNTVEDADQWQQTISLSTTENNVIIFGKFANFQNNNAIKGRITTNGLDKFINVTPSPQTANGIGLDGCNHEFNSDGNGAKLVQVGGKWTFSVKFTDKITGGGGTCTPTGNVSFEDVFTQL